METLILDANLEESVTKAAEIMQQIGKLSSEKADHILEVIKDLST